MKCLIFKGHGAWSNQPVWALRDTFGTITTHNTFEEAVEELNRVIRSK